jgi:hypothetical protein
MRAQLQGIGFQSLELCRFNPERLPSALSIHLQDNPENSEENAPQRKEMTKSEKQKSMMRTRGNLNANWETIHLPCWEPVKPAEQKQAMLLVYL